MWCSGTNHRFLSATLPSYDAGPVAHETRPKTNVRTALVLAEPSLAAAGKLRARPDQFSADRAGHHHRATAPVKAGLSRRGCAPKRVGARTGIREATRREGNRQLHRGCEENVSAPCIQFRDDLTPHVVVHFAPDIISADEERKLRNMRSMRSLVCSDQNVHTKAGSQPPSHTCPNISPAASAVSGHSFLAAILFQEKET